MDAEVYKIAEEAHIIKYRVLLFAFLSKGRYGDILKIIKYYPITKDGNPYFNLGFGDAILDEQGQIVLDTNGFPRVNDKAESNNGDMKKVLATVVGTISVFFTYYPNATLHVTGSTEQRTKVYRYIVIRYQDDIEAVYQVYGYLNNVREVFMSDKTYDYILIDRK